MSGQSTLEYLVTYGWAVLVILVVLAVLWYYGIFDGAKWKTDHCADIIGKYNISYCDELSYPMIKCMMPDNKTICACKIGAYDKLVLSDCDIVINPLG
jgi:hypothetical protein